MSTRKEVYRAAQVAGKAKDKATVRFCVELLVSLNWFMPHMKEK